MKISYDEEASAMGGAALKAISLGFVALIIVAFTTNGVPTGTKSGDRAPNITGKAYNGSVWVDFDLSTYFDFNWEEGEVNGQWVAIEFMDTDCPYCVQSAKEYGEMAQYFSASNPDWTGPQVNFLASATQLKIEGHESSRGEIAAFRDKTTGYDCNKQDCANRGGGVHNFPYIDDLDLENMALWDVPGTPAYFLIQPDGIVAWSSAESSGEKLSDAILAYTPQEGA